MVNRLTTQAAGNNAGPGRQCRSNSRTGYTLLELLIVLAVLAALAALVLPAIRGPLDKSRLTAAAQQIQASLAKARALAIREGTAVQIRCQLHGQSLRIERIQPSLVLNIVANDESSSSTVGEENASNLDDKNLLRILTLPVGVQFESIQSQNQSGSPTEQGSSESRWSTPIVFTPDGRTENAVIEIRGQRDFIIQIQLRGLTGFATYSAPQRSPVLTTEEHHEEEM